jgi:hypothetical protein
MGQYWQLINLDKRQTFGHWGKLLEFIHSSEPSTVVPYLTIPITALPASVENSHLIGSWAGDRIICVGDYVDSYLPDGMLTEDEINEAGEKNVYEVAREYTEVTSFDLPRLPDAFGHDRVWVLRNLSKREFVRNNALGDKTTNILGPAGGDPGLGDALLSRICWSSDPSGSKDLCDDITYGVWAGDRFDIQPIDTVENEDDWKDVSEEVAEDVAVNISDW